MSEYKLGGEIETGVVSALPVDGASVGVRAAVRIEPSLRADGPVTSLDIADDDVLEIELDDGTFLWTTVDRLRSDAARAGILQRDDDSLPTAYPADSGRGERGAVSNGIRALKVLNVDLPKGGALRAAAKIESRLAGDGQFFRISEKGALSRENPPETGDNEATLVLIHGTASSTANAYSGLFDQNAATWKHIHDEYDGRVFAFEHRTLTKSPLENTLEFLDGIPPGSNLHLLTHSRGGLIGDLVAHGGIGADVFAADDLERELARTLEGGALEQEIERYRSFNRIIVEKSPSVRRYVRVGCPAAGTTLASGRLDIYLSILINLLRLTPGAGSILGGLGEFAAAVAKERTKPDVLPGLEAQMPKSPFIRLLNGSDHVLESDLTVLAGDSDGFLKNLANLFYWRANDLVVDTRSMYGGAQRDRRLWHLEENRHVTHVNYFSRFETAEIVRRGLLRYDDDTAGFAVRRPKGAIRGRVTEGKPDENAQLTGVVLLPGIMGSNLAVSKGGKLDTVWVDGIDLLRGRGRALAVDSGLDLVPAGVFDSPYEDFRDDLVRHNIHVMPMPYDWRLSLDAAVSRLETLVSERLAASSEPLHLVGHSMGGLVASLFMVRHPHTWRRLRDAGGRLVQAGTPNRGSFVIPRILQGEERVIRLLAAADLANGLESWLRWTSQFHGVLEMAPTTGDLEFAKVDTWRQLGVRAVPRASDLRATAPVRQALLQQTGNLAAEGVLYVAGGPCDTPVFDPVSGEIRFTERGDGRVTWDSGIPPRASTWYVPVKHGSLLDTRRAFAGLRDLLIHGHTDRLSTEPPPASSLLRGASRETPTLGDPEQIEFVPTSDDLIVAALDMESPSANADRSAAPLLSCEISVVHGDLRFTEYPVMVGHYRGDPIVHAERVLDDRLDGALRSRHQLGVYPGEIGSAEVIFWKGANAPRRHHGPAGAIVLGLGNVGELTPGGLTRAAEAGLLQYAQACLERGVNTATLKVSALMVGSGEAGISIPGSAGSVSDRREQCQPRAVEAATEP